MSRSHSRGAYAGRIARIAAATSVLATAAFGFLVAGDEADFASRTIASWQFFPSAERAIASGLAGFGTAGFVACIAALAVVALSALFGRWYCAALCPLGTLQDLASLLRRKNRAYRNPHNLLRVLAFVLAVCVVTLGSSSLASWIDPWSLFSRFFTYDLRPLVRLASREDLPGLNAVTVVAAAVAMAAILLASVLSGRWFCGNLCPVGGVLGVLNRFAPLRVRVESSYCVSCGKCALVCRATCIDAAAKRLDSSRCVNCLACVGSCPTGALHYGIRAIVPDRGGRVDRPRRAVAPASGLVTEKGQVALSRGQFIAAVGGGIAAISLAALPGRAFAVRAIGAETLGRDGLKPVIPPGARSLERFLGACVACGLCIDRCPSKVLQPSLGQLGARGLMAPRLDHSISYCQFDCTSCLDACPSGALEKLSLEKKRLTKIGDARLIRDRCVVFKNRTKCGACAEHCPTGAVRMVVGETGLPEPVFTSSICIGCGACHHACPVRPDRAISVSGIAVHTVADTPSPNLFDATPKPASKSGTPGASAGTDAFPF
jgi:ferredoxin